LADVALAVLSPGVPLESSVVGAITRSGVPYVSELELGIELHGGKSIVVTGSNGKSTTVSLIHHILSQSGLPSYLCGNVGTPVIASDEIGRGSKDRSLLVVEASSYQLEACTVLKPAVSVILNVSENHLERHGTLERYAAAKARVCRLQDGRDLAVLNVDDPVVRTMGQATGASVAFFGARSPEELEKLSPNWASITYSSGSSARVKIRLDGSNEEYDLGSSRLLGAHNAYNIAAAVLAARRVGASREAVLSAIETFAPLEHRLEPIFTDGVRVVINDSKSTTVAATVAAYTTVREHYQSQRLVLMIGGLSKAGSWDPLLKQLENAPGAIPVVCFGKDGSLLANHCKARNIPHHVSPSLSDATRTALAMIEKGGVMLLSPGCASFDEFRDFEQRGEQFKHYVSSLVGVSAA
jgi:UDP-N-acetylmuramoylalanine--D-glutamate ligase